MTIGTVVGECVWQHLWGDRYQSLLDTLLAETQTDLPHHLGNLDRLKGLHKEEEQLWEMRQVCRKVFSSAT